LEVLIAFAAKDSTAGEAMLVNRTYDHRRSPGAYSSCEKFKGADITPETWLSSAYWSRTADPNAPMPEIKLKNSTNGI